MSSAPAKWAEEREAFYDKQFGKCALVVHEMIPRDPHIDIFIYEPNKNRPFYTLISSGASEYLMKTPNDIPAECRRVEFFMRVPDIKVETGSTEHPWQVDLLRYLASFAVNEKTWVGEFHTIPSGDPPEPYVEGSELTTVLLMPPAFDTDAMMEGLTYSDGTPISFLWVDFITTAECKVKLDKGQSALFDLFDENKHPHVLNINRTSYA